MCFSLLFLDFHSISTHTLAPFLEALWRTHDWSHGLPTVCQAFLVLRPGYTFHSVFFPASSVRCIAFRPCLTQTLCQYPYTDSPTTVQAFLSGLSPRLPRFPEVPLLRYLVISVSGVIVYMWPVLPVAWLTVISEESVYWFVCCRETDNLYPFILEHIRPNLIYILLCVDITVVPGSTFRAFPFSDAQILNICIFIPATSAGLWWRIPSADFSEILTSTLHFILYHC